MSHISPPIKSGSDTLRSYMILGEAYDLPANAVSLDFLFLEN